MEKKSLLIRLFALVAAMMCALGIHAQEAYACYTSSNTTLTFYYDNYRNSRPGTTYDLNEDYRPGWVNDGTNAYVTEVVFDSSFAGARPTTTYHWFYYMHNLQSITGMSYLNTSEVTDMDHMFVDCIQLTSIDVSHFNTENVKKMQWMFVGCESLTSLDLSSFNTSKVTDMQYMFFDSSKLRTIYVGTGWSTASVTETYSKDMFKNCLRLVGGQGTTYSISNPRDKTYAHIDGGTSNPGYFTAEGEEPWINPEAYACYTPSNTTLTFYYDFQRSSRPGTTYDLNEGINDPGWYTDGTNASVTKVVFDPSFADARPMTTFGWFLKMQNLESITDMSYLNTSEVTNMGLMFHSCNQLTSIDVSHFNTSNVHAMNAMFYGCNSLTSIDLSAFNTTNVTLMRAMFESCTNLQKIYVGSGWNTDKVSDSERMFKGCENIVGEQGTTYDASQVDKAYAHIDGGESNPGYLSSENSKPLLFEMDGIWYNRTSPTTVEVTYKNTNYNSYSGEVTIPATVTYEGRTYGVTAIGDNAFRVCTYLTKVTIPNTVAVIGHNAFFLCQTLQTIECLAVTPPSVFSDTFSSYSAALMVPSGSKAAYQAADYWKNFTDIHVIPSNPYDFVDNGIYYKYAGYNAVEVVNDGTDEYFCYSGNVEIPESAYDAADGWYYLVGSIGERAFYRCPSLVTVTIPPTVNLIHNEAFVDCFDEYPDQSSITCLALTPPTVSPTAFDSSEQSYVTLYVPYGTKSAYQAAAAVWRNFSNIVELNYSFKKYGFYYKITGSNTVCVTYKDASYNTYSGRVLIPQRVTFDGVTYTVTAIDNLAFFGCTGLTEVSIPETVTTIGNRTFKNCTSLTSITIPNSVTSIGVYTFENCEELTEVTLGSGLQSIGSAAFYGCTELMRGNIISLATVPPAIQNSTFETGHYNGASLYVPFGCHDAYANATYWENFYDIYEIITLDEALNVDGGIIEFASGGDYPWTVMKEAGRAYAQSGNAGEPSSTSTLTAMVHVEGNSMLSFDFKAWGEGTNASYDECVFLIDGREQFCYGALQNDWETYSVDLEPGDHILEWIYEKDESVNPPGDYFAVDNVTLTEAYACYTPSNTTLTFYYDNQRNSRTGSIYDLNYDPGWGSDMPDWYDWDGDGISANVTKVVFDPSFAAARPTTTYGWFYQMVNLQSITGMKEYLNTTEVIEMSNMFDGCRKLTSLDLSSFSTSQVSSMNWMFYNCSNLRTIYVGSGWSTTAVEYSNNMFNGCTNLVGGQGTTYDANHVDKTYAHIDGGPTNPGYFTDKNASIPGDVTGEGDVDVSDVNAVINIILHKKTEADYPGNADITGEGNIDVSDVNAIINIILHKN